MYTDGQMAGGGLSACYRALTVAHHAQPDSSNDDFDSITVIAMIQCHAIRPMVKV
jgi:hypothetical protein